MQGPTTESESGGACTFDEETHAGGNPDLPLWKYSHHTIQVAGMAGGVTCDVTGKPKGSTVATALPGGAGMSNGDILEVDSGRWDELIATPSVVGSMTADLSSWTESGRALVS